MDASRNYALKNAAKPLEIST